jgi:isopenicillin-N epimerase
MSENQVSESKALDAFREAEERLHESRRRFFKLAGIGAAALGSGSLGWPRDAFAYGGPYAKAFVLDDDTLYMNIGTTGSTPREVLKNLDKNNTQIAADPLVNFNTQTLRNTIAAGFGADPNEIVMSFNTTDGMSKIMAGLELPPGSEIITTNMEHPGGNGPMTIARDRDDLTLTRINLPTNDAMSDAEVLARFQAAFKPGVTKAIEFSSPPYLTGVRLNEKQLCEWAEAEGLISIIDGAHATGMINLNFHDMGVDYYAGSGHKWQCGPGQTGILYIRNGNTPGAYTKSVTVYNGLSSDTSAVTINLAGYANTSPLSKFWPTVSSAYSGTAGSVLDHGTRNPAHNVAATMMSIGNPSYPALKALQECCSLWDAWGRQNIENYLVALAQYLRARLFSIWGPKCLAAPYDPGTPHYARVGLTGFNPFSPGYDFNAVLSAAEAAAQTTASGNAVTALRDQHGVVVRNTNCPHSLRGNSAMSASGNTTSHPLRISTHLFHRSQDVDRLVNALLRVVPHP